MQDTQEKTFIFDGEELEYYPEDIDVPIIESPLDSAKYDNNDVSLDEVLANLGGHFHVCNTDILNAKW